MDDGLILLNAKPPMLGKVVPDESLKVTLIKLALLLNALPLIDVTELGIITEFKSVLLNEESPIVAIELPKVTDWNCVQFLNALAWIVVREFGRAMPNKAIQLVNAELLIFTSWEDEPKVTVFKFVKE